MERRAHKRIRLDVPVRYAVHGEWKEARCLDLSPGGVRLAGSVLERGQRVRIELALPGADEPLTLEGIALHTESADDGQPLTTGVKFLRVSPATGAWLTQYVDGALEGAPPQA